MNSLGASSYGEATAKYPEIRGTADAAGGSADCLMIVANTIEMNGTSGLDVNNACSNFGGLDDIFVADLRLRLMH